MRIAALQRERRHGEDNGIGGVFFRARDPRLLAEDAGPTIISPFAQDTGYFGRAEQQWLINFRVDDLDGMIIGLKAAGIAVETPEEWDSEVGHFARIHDPEGNPIEFWEPSMDPVAAGNEADAS